MSNQKNEPNLLDALLVADADGIEEAVQEIATRIGARSCDVTIALSFHQGVGSVAILTGVGGDHCSTMSNVIEQSRVRRHKS